MKSMGIFSKILKRDDPLVTTPPLTIVATKRVVKKPAKKAPVRKAVTMPASEPAPKAAPEPAPKKVAKPAAKKAPAKRGPRKDYKGDVHDVVDLEGIGPAYADRLKAAKIHHTQQLLFASNVRLQKVTGAPPKTVENWKHMSQLVKINGIGPQFAEVMVRAGLGGIEELKTLDCKQAVAQVKAYTDGLDANVLGSGIGMKRLTDWQAQAKSMRKVPIDLSKIEVVALESTAAKADESTPVKKAPAKKPAAKKPAAKKSAAKPAAKKSAAKKPAAKKSAAKKPVAKAAAKKPAAAKAPVKKQVSRGDYLLYKSGPRHFFSKKKAVEKGWTRIYTVPAGFKIQVTNTGLPVLAKKQKA